MMQTKMSQVVDAGSGQQQLVAPSAQPCLFTLTFRGGQIALLNVYGASTKQEARGIAESVIKNACYTVVDGDYAGGKAHCFYYWHVQAQERNPRLDSLSRGA